MKNFFIWACVFFIVAVGAYFSKNYWIWYIPQTQQSITDTWSIVLSTGSAEEIVNSILTGLENIGSGQEGRWSDVWVKNTWIAEEVLDQNNNDTPTLFSEKYTVKYEESPSSIGAEVVVYDKMWNRKLSLWGDERGSVLAIIWDYVAIKNPWDSMQWLSIYNILTKEKVLKATIPTKTLFPKSLERSDKYEIHTEWSKIYFPELVYTPINDRTQKPEDAPDCPKERTTILSDQREIDNYGYSELRVFDITTQTLEKTNELVCTFIQ